MSEEGAGPSEEQVSEATSLGWAPKDKWRGDPEKWVDADVFLERGMGIHHVKGENQQLKSKVDVLSGQLNEMTGALRAATAAIAALEESRDEDVKEQVEAARKRLKEELAAASREGDHDAVAELTVKLTDLAQADDDAKHREGKPKNQPTAPQVHPEVKTWFEQHPEFTRDKRRTALGRVAAEELRAEGETAVGAAFMDLVAARVDEVLGKPASERKPSKAESGNGGGTRSGGGGGSSGKTYSDLPKEAKEACDRMAKRLVGPDRKHKDINSWRSSYAAQYFAQEQ